MKTKEQNPIERKLDEKAFEKCYEAIEGGNVITRCLLAIKNLLCRKI